MTSEAGVGFRTPFPILYTTDVERLSRFYRELLGFTEVYRFPPQGEPGYVALELDGARFGVGMPPGHLPTAGRAAPTTEVCIYTDDVDAAVAFLRDRGIPVRAEPADQPWGERNAYVEDPDGNPVHIASAPSPAPSAR